MADSVIDNPGRHRFELDAGSGHQAILVYERRGGRMALIHTEVPKALAGQGVGSRLVEGALAIIRGEGLKVVAQCSFVAAYIQRHREEQDLLADGS